MDDMKRKVYESLFFDIHSYTYDKKDSLGVYQSESIAGCRDKRFYRIDGKFFTSYFDNPSNYITYVDEYVREGYVFDRLSVMVKACEFDRYRATNNGKWIMHSEIMGTQVMDCFGCPCAYNVAVLNNDKHEGDYDVFSINFIGEGDEFYTFTKLGVSFAFDLRRSSIKLEEKLDELFEDFDDKEKQKAVETYVYSYLVRKYVARDIDIGQSNLGLIVNREKGTIKFINFDLEYCFCDESGGLEKDLEYCYSRFPEVYRRFVEMVESYRKALNELRDEGVQYQSYIQERYVINLACALRYVQDCIDYLDIDIEKRRY